MRKPRWRPFGGSTDPPCASFVRQGRGRLAGLRGEDSDEGNRRVGGARAPAGGRARRERGGGPGPHRSPLPGPLAGGPGAAGPRRRRAFYGGRAGGDLAELRPLHRERYATRDPSTPCPASRDPGARARRARGGEGPALTVAARARPRIAVVKPWRLRGAMRARPWPRTWTETAV